MFRSWTLHGSWHNFYLQHFNYTLILKHCISITRVQSYTGKYHEFVAVCIVMCSTSNNANGNKRVIFFLA